MLGAMIGALIKIFGTDLGIIMTQFIASAAKVVNVKDFANAVGTFLKTENINMILDSINPNYRPWYGTPNSKYTAPNGDWRIYGPDGLPKQDYDTYHGPNHPTDKNGGHYHDYDHSKPQNEARGPAYVPANQLVTSPSSGFSWPEINWPQIGWPDLQIDPEIFVTGAGILAFLSLMAITVRQALGA